MGGSKSKSIEFGTIKLTGEALFREGVVSLEPGELLIGNSKELKFVITSKERGVFSIAA